MLFAAFTVVIILIIVVLCPAAGTAVSLALATLALAVALRGPGAGRPGREGYFPQPGAGAPHAVGFAGPRPRAPAPSRYPGAIDGDEYDTDGVLGHRDTLEADGASDPFGNPFNIGRDARPPAAGACEDDEANDAEMDADELNTYQARSRNDETRVEAGVMNRRKTLDKYFREEVEEAEDRQWWGRHEE